MARRKRYSKDSFYRTVIVGCYLSLGVNLLLGVCFARYHGEKRYAYMAFLGIASLVCGVIHALSTDRTAHRRDSFSDMLVCVVACILLTIWLVCEGSLWILMPFGIECLLMGRFYLRNHPVKR